jgi:hypothetical protein
VLGLKGNSYCYDDVIEIYPFQLMLLANINVDQGWVNGKLALVHRAYNNRVVIRAADRKSQYLTGFALI